MPSSKSGGVMKHKATLFVADLTHNKFMSAFDMRPDYKWFVVPTEVSFVTQTPVNEDYFMNIINKSKEDPTFWIPAVKYMDNIYFSPDVKILSDGIREMFIQEV